jgi:hypothetical protein
LSIQNGILYRQPRKDFAPFPCEPLQESIPHEFLSRVSSIFSLVAMGLGPVGFALCGPAADLVGTERVLEAGAGAMLLSVAALLFSRSVKRFPPSHGGGKTCRHAGDPGTCLDDAARQPSMRGLPSSPSAT